MITFIMDLSKKDMCNKVIQFTIVVYFIGRPGTTLSMFRNKDLKKKYIYMYMYHILPSFYCGIEGLRVCVTIYINMVQVIDIKKNTFCICTL